MTCVRRADRDPVQLPARYPAQSVGDLNAGSHEVLVARPELDDVAEDVLRGALGVQDVVRVQVLGVEHAVPVGAPPAQVSPGKDRNRTGQNPLAEREVVDHRAAGAGQDRRPVAQDADVVDLGVEDVDGAALRVQRAEPTSWRPVKTVSAPTTVRLSGATATASSSTVPRSKTSTAPAASALRAGRMEDPELQELVAGEVHAGGAQRADHRAPARARGARGQRPPRVVVALHHAAGGIGMQRHEQCGLQAFAAARDAG